MAPMDAQQVHRDVEETLGLVPSFVKEIPPAAVEGFWLKMKNFELEETALPPKVKDLIGVAVAAAIPCGYCVFFHKEGARGNGASDAEIREAIAMAATVREGSTILNGFQQDVASFQDEVREMMRHVERQRGHAGGQRARP